METCLTTKDVIDFLLNAYFGNLDNPIHTAANAAYLDLNRTIEFKKNADINDEVKVELRHEAVEIIKQSIDKLTQKKDINQDAFDKWHTTHIRQQI